MDDREILAHIDKLVTEEHHLWGQSGEEGGLSSEERMRLDGLKVDLDRLWDLLDQRRALREADRNPDQATLRDAKTVENYLQ